MGKQTFEQSGLIPRSIIRTFDKFRIQLLPGSEKNIIQNFRISRYQVLVSVQSLIILFFFPLLVNIILKNIVLTPLTELFWNNYQKGIFLNSSQQECALQEIQNFEEKIFFETLIEEDFLNWYSDGFTQEDFIKQKIQQKTIELSFEYNQQSIIALTNIFGDFGTLISIMILLSLMKPQIIILNSFLTESIYSLSDTTKSFLLIFFTDLLVGFHSPRGWDLILDFLFKHFGLPENQNFILLFVATFPVLLDTVFKYWIFRYLNKISPSTVATYHNMIE